MKYKLLSCVAAAAVVLASSQTFAGNQGTASQKPVSKVSDVQNMADDSMVYVQGYIIQSLGDENYVFQDDSGQINVEIDDDLMNSASVTPETVVWIAATIDKDTGQPTSLEAEEIQFLPAGSGSSITMSNNTNNKK